MSAGGSFSQMEQVGHGAVDSGHTCLQGCIEVVILRRLPECHKRNACRMVPSLKVYQAEASSPLAYGRDEASAWPTEDTIKEWERMG